VDAPEPYEETERDEMPRPQLLDRRSFLREIVETLLLIVAIYTLVNLATSRYVVEGQSMLPNFEGNEYLIVNRFEYMFGDPQRGDIIIFHYPENPDRDFIKRVVGLPGETIRMEDGQIYIDDVPLAEPYVLDLCSRSNCEFREWVIEEDQYFVLGDNRNSSQDSTRFGPVDRDLIVGRAWVKYWPPSEWEVIEHHTYGDPPVIPEPQPTPTLVPGTPESPIMDSVGGG
jgi:signal peptidase I